MSAAEPDAALRVNPPFRVEPIVEIPLDELCRDLLQAHRAEDRREGLDDHEVALVGLFGPVGRLRPSFEKPLAPLVEGQLLAGLNCSERSVVARVEPVAQKALGLVAVLGSRRLLDDAVVLGARDCWA